MKKKHPFFYHIAIFIIAQLAWLLLLGIWIYWYVTNYIIFKNVGEKLSPKIIYNGTNVFPFVGGLILLVGIAFSMSLIFRHLNVQLKLNKLYDNFISNITHELKSPLSSIQLYLETLNSRNVPPDKQREFIDLMMKDASRLKNLINSILEISALEQKKVSHSYQVYEADSLFKKLVEESVEQFKLPAGSIKIEGKTDCKCVVDRSALKIVMNNLIDNALKYSIEEVSININLSRISKKLIVEIADKGIGIPAGELKKIFNKFYRIYDINIPNVKGTGLGLYWIREIIKTHGGKITALSEGKDKGSMFRIELPVFQVSKKRLLDRLLRNTSKRGEVSENEGVSNYV